MTDEEKAIKDLCIKCSSYDFCVKGNQLHCAETVAYIKGLAEGRKETLKAIDVHREENERFIEKLTKADQLEKENAELKKKYDELNDFSNSQCAELLKENQELKAELEKEKRRSMNIQKICFDSCL